MRIAVLASIFGAAAAFSGLADDFTSDAYLKDFHEQWSYNKQDKAGHDQHFDVGDHGGRRCLRVRIYHDDKTFRSGSDTCPRSELAMNDKSALTSHTAYELQWETNLQQYSSPYMFALMQLFGGNGPNIFIRWESGKYILWCEQCKDKKQDFPGTAQGDVGKWISWHLSFKLSSGSDGYLHLSRDGSSLVDYHGKTTDGSAHHLKLGLYTQHVCTVEDAAILLSNLSLKKAGAAELEANHTVVV